MKQLSSHRVWLRVLLLVFTIETVYIHKEPRLQKLWGCRDRIGRVGRLCKWLTILSGLPTGCSRRLFLQEQNVFHLFCFLESMATHSSHNSYKVGMIALLGGSSEGFRSKLQAPFSHRKLSVWPPWRTMLTCEMHDHSSLMNVICFIWSHYDLSLMLAFQVNVICFTWLQLQMSFVVNRRASWIILTVLFRSELPFVPLLGFSLWSKQDIFLIIFFVRVEY